VLIYTHMKIVFTGGGTGGHFFPIIAVAEQLNKIIDDDHIAEGKLYFFSDSDKFDKQALVENGIKFVKVSAGKKRVGGGGLRNFFDLFKIAFGVVQAVIKLFIVFPDLVFSKGGYASFPTLVAARLFRIPVILHESDSYPGRVNVWAGKFAKRIAISYKESAEFFPGQENKIAYTGQPIRQEISMPTREGAYEFLGLEEGIPVIFIQGGSQGAYIINYVVEEMLPKLVEKYQIIHQVGEMNLDQYKKMTDAALITNKNKGRYKQFGFLNPLAMKMSAGVADLVISRAGSSIFEIAEWKIPSIIIPIKKTNGDHQRKNAYNYARSGSCVVVEEDNLQPNLLMSEISRILDDKKVYDEMVKSASKFSTPAASEKIAKEIVEIALSHEK